MIDVMAKKELQARVEELYNDLDIVNELLINSSSKTLHRAYSNLETIILNGIMETEGTI